MPREDSRIARVEEYVEDNLLHRITSGYYPLGSQLPSCRKLAAEFGVSHTTAHKVLKRLEQKGYVAAFPAVGTFVRPVLPAAEAVVLDDLQQDLDTTLRAYRRNGLSKDNLLALVADRVGEIYGIDGPKVAFVECNRHDTHVLSQHISRIIGQAVEGVLLEDLLDKPVPYATRFDVLITTYFHVAEVNDAIGAPDRVIAVHHRPSHASLERVVRLPRNIVVGVLGANERTIRLIIGTVQGYGVGEVIGACLSDEGAVEDALVRADVVVDSMGVHGAVSRLPVKVPVLTIEFALDPESVRQLKHRFAQLHEAALAH